MICCTKQVPYELINTTVCLIYLIIIKNNDPHTFPAAFSLFVTLFYKRGYTTYVVVTAILINSDVMTLATILFYVLILYCKPCDVYTLSVIAILIIKIILVNVFLIFEYVKLLSKILIHFDKPTSL